MYSQAGRAEISLYPLRRNELTKPIQQFVQVLDNDKLQVKTGSMSTFVTGESRVVFENLQKAFEQVAKKYEVVVSARISNACPEVNKEEYVF